MKCVTYARVSSKEQERDGYSIPAQKKLLVEYALKGNLQIVAEFVDVETAKTSGRTEFGRMISFLKSHKDVKIIVVEKTDRLYRNFKDAIILEDLELALHLVKEGEVISRDSRSQAKFVHGIRVLLAKNYSDNLSEETKKGLREKAEQGEFPGKAPFGYINDKTEKSIIPDAKYAPLVRMMFEQYSTGQFSLATLRDAVYNDGWRTPSGRKLAKSMIAMILKNPFYIGRFIWKGEIFDGIHEPLLRRELYESAQAVFGAVVRSRTSKRDFQFKGVLTCKYCGCALVGELKKGKYTYYHCTQGRGQCNHPWIREEDLESSVAEVFKAIEIDDSTVGDIVEALKQSGMQERQFRKRELARLEKRKRDLQRRLDQAYVDRLDGTIDDGYWRHVSIEWREEQNAVQSKLIALTSSSRNYVDEALRILELSKMAHTLYLDRSPSEKRKLLKTVLSNCTSDGTTLYPTYNKPFDLVAEGRQNQLKLPRLDSN